MKLKINVTQENIDASKLKSKCECPIALAVLEESLNHGARKTPYGVEATASIDHEKGRLHFGDVKVEFPLPPEARTFIRNRDEGFTVAPFSFTVQADPEPKSTCMNWGFDPNKDRSFEP